jgi:hypothetical protein
MLSCVGVAGHWSKLESGWLALALQRTSARTRCLLVALLVDDSLVNLINLFSLAIGVHTYLPLSIV